MKSSDNMYMSVLQALLSDIQITHPIRGIERDKQTLFQRFKDEGLGFLTKTIPLLDDALLQGLETGNFKCPTSFHKKKGTALPALWHGLLSYIFDRNGCLREEADIEAIRHLRQLCCLFKKAAIPHSKSAKEVQYEKYCQAETDMAKVNRQIRKWNLDPDTCWVIHKARIIIQNLCSDVDLEALRPKNGPGSTSCRSSNPEKWVFDRKLARKFEWMFGEYLYRYNPIKPHPGEHARLVEVPKDSRGPRLISMEPREYQWIQQGIWRSIEQSILHTKYFGRNIRFRDAETNGRLALESSMTRVNATIDWSSASDRIAHQLVKFLFPRPLFEAMETCSSRDVEVPWQSEPMHMEKFAPMGNALCFPVESMIFYALAVASIAHKRGTHNLTKIAKQVHVFGDDTIVPVSDAPAVISAMEKLGMVHNCRKTFIHGFFRESCGVDAYKGENITPRYFRGAMDLRRTCHGRKLSKDGQINVIKIDAFADQLYKSSYWMTANFLHSAAEEALGGIYPSVSSRSAVLGRKVHYGDLPAYDAYDVALQRPVVRGFVKQSPKASWGEHSQDGYPRLLRNLIENPEEPDKFG